MADNNAQTTFKNDMDRLSQIVDMLERNQVELEEGVELYKEACACAQRCREKLEKARNVLNDNGQTRDAEDFLRDGGQGAGGWEAPF